MRVGIVSDTHDNEDAVQFAIETFEDAGVEAVLHLGDFVAPFSAVPWDREWDVHAVRGNNDGEWALMQAVEDFGTYHGECAVLDLDGTSIAMYHGTSEPLVDGLVECGRYDFVIHGHTHQRSRDTVGGTMRLNPGGIAIPQSPEPFSVAVIDTADESVEFSQMESSG